jgi:chemotaxis protein MotB
MSAKKEQHEEPAGESAPMWIVSFADLVTLLMSFFVILSVKPEGTASVQDPAFQQVAAAIRAAFKNLPPADPTMDPRRDFEDLSRRLMALMNREGTLNRGDSNEKGIQGRSFRVRRMRDGMEITVGGPVMFEPFSVKPTAEGEASLRQVFNIIKGKRNIIEIKGHAGEEPWPADWKYEDAMKLSYERARYVASRLLEQGSDPRTIRLVAVGPNEPVTRQAYEETLRAENRRVEIIVRESLIDDYVGQSPAPSPASQPAGTLNSSLMEPEAQARG